ncbi:MAG: caspase family protein [Arenibacterium sp.]
MLRLLLFVFFTFVPALAWASKVALVIGNSDYTSVATLDNPANDARDVSAALERQGFEVTTARNLGRNEMRDALRRFRTLADSAEVALVYYAGHGIEIEGQNYLIPVDARLEDERDAPLEMIQLDLILGQISGARTLKMVVLDACRNNPFIVRMQSNDKGRNIQNGLGRIDSVGADTLVAYAAAAGDITPDGLPGGNSPFTSAFLAALDGPPTDVRRLFGTVRDKLRETVPGAAPFVYTSLGGKEFVINPNSVKPEPKPEPQPVVKAPETQPVASTILQDFVTAERVSTLNGWSDFLITHRNAGDHPLYALALEKRAELRAALNAPKPKPEPEPDVVVAAREPDTQVQQELVPDTAPLEEPDASRTLVVVPPVLNEDDQARRLQELLQARNCYSGAIDGQLGRMSRGAMRSFSREAGASFSGSLTGLDRIMEAISVVEANEGVNCPVVANVRRTPATSTVARPRTSQTQPRVVQQPKPAPKVENKPASGGFSTRSNRSKPLPDVSTDCIGARRQLFDCD